MSARSSQKQRAALRHDSGVTISQRGGDDAVNGETGGGLVLLEIEAAFPHEHVHVAHAVVGVEIVHIAQIKVHQPRIECQLISFVLGIIAVGQAGVEAVVVALGIAWPVPRRLLGQEKLAVTVECLGECRSARGTRVIVHQLPWCNGSMHVAVTVGIAEFLFQFRCDLRRYFLRPCRFGRVHPEPPLLQLIVRSPYDVVNLIILVGSANIGILAVRAIDVTQCVAQIF